MKLPARYMLCAFAATSRPSSPVPPMLECNMLESFTSRFVNLSYSESASASKGMFGLLTLENHATSALSS